ncbi:DNA polymerase iota [Polymixia lowei]
MENSADDLDEEDEAEWRRSSTDSQVQPAAVSGVSCNKIPPPNPPQRVILHFDLDCFYAQVEMIRNPTLRNVPLGIQQKYIIVTCNYVARGQGVTKMMSVTDAKEKCPQLVLVKGEDLTHYREMSYKVTELLMSYCPLVERLGFDENFVDITEMVERKLIQTAEPHSYSFQGHVYNHAGGDANASDHPRLALASHIAAELRADINSKLGLTGCAGIATNKLLAKLVSGTFKPNQQTTLLPGNIEHIMNSLSGLRKVPGVGHQTSKRLQALGLVSVRDLQLFPLADLVQEFGGSSAERLRNLSLGIDDTPVTPTGAPQSLSDEDSFKKMSSTTEVLQKIQDLLSSLVQRLHKDGRQAQTFRLTIRRYSAKNKCFSRESRQCPVPNHIGQKITSGSSDALAQLVTLAMKLFHKMVDSSSAFNITLINVCFTNLQSKGAAANRKGSIMYLFTHSTSPRKTQSSSQKNQDDLPPSGRSRLLGHGFECDVKNSSTDGMITQDTFQMTTPTERPPSATGTLHGLPTTQSTVPPGVAPECQKDTCSTAGSDQTVNTPKLTCQLPPDVDPDMFRLLPEDIQRELSSPSYPDPLGGPPTPTTSQSATGGPAPAFDTPHISNKYPPQSCPPASMPPSRSFADSHSLKDGEEAASDLDSSDTVTTVNHTWPPGSSTVPVSTVSEEGKARAGPSVPQSPDCGFPVDVDPTVFSELPPDVQRELMSEWRQQRPVLKTPSCRKQGRNSVVKGRKAAAKGSQTNNLLNYFKPN